MRCSLRVGALRALPLSVVPTSWRLVERSFHNDNRLSWWLSHLSSPLD